MTPDWFAEADARTTTTEVALRLGLPMRGRRIGGLRCCNKDDKRGTATAYEHTWACACGAKGNMSALVRVTRPELSWAEVRAWFADAGWCSSDGQEYRPLPPLPPRPPPPPMPYADPDELARFLTLGGPIEDDPEVHAFWHARGFGPRTGAAWALPERARWPAWWPLGYKSLYRLACPMYDAQGVVRSVHARAVRDPGTWPDGKPRMKTCAPKGVRGDSLLFADPWLGVWLLRGESVPTEVLVCEGITDYCAATSIRLPGVAILGGISGSFGALAGVRFPAGCVVYVGTDNDPAGDAYAAQVRAAVKGDVRRVVWGTNPDGTVADGSDLVKRGEDLRARLAVATTM